MGTLIDETGKQYGRLTVVRRASHSRGRSVTWLCRCECGKEVTVIGQSLRNGRTTSCGCYWQEQIRRARALPNGKAAMHKVLYQYKHDAKRRKLKWGITEIDFENLTQQPCYYCGTEPANVGHWRNETGNYIHNGLDRVDNNGDYVLENIVSCCGQCNRAKGQMSYDEFLDWVNRIYKRLNS